MPPAPREIMSSTRYRHSRSTRHPRSSRKHSSHDTRWYPSDSLGEYSVGAYDGFSEGAIVQEANPYFSSDPYSTTPYSTTPYSTTPYSTTPYSTDPCLLSQPPRSFSGAYGSYSSGVSGPHSGYDLEQSSSVYTPDQAESRDGWYAGDDTERFYTSVTDASNPRRHGAPLWSPNSYLAEETTRDSLLMGQEALTPPHEHKRELTMPPHQPRGSATVGGVPEWLLPIQHHELFPAILQAWTKFINLTSRGSSSGMATASPAHLPFPPSGFASSSCKRKQPSGRRETSPEDTKDHPDGLGTLADEDSAGAGGPERQLACHYYKRDAVEFMGCHWSTFQEARGVTQHLRNKHGVTLQQLPRMPAKKGQDESHKWYWTWRQVFPGHAEPASPYHDPFELLNQFVQHIIREEYSPEVLSVILLARSSFASRSSFRQLSNPAPSGYETTDRPNGTPQPNDPGTTDTHNSHSLEAYPSGSPLLQNHNIGADTDADFTSELAPVVRFLGESGTTEQPPLTDTTYDNFQPDSFIIGDQMFFTPAADITPTDLGQVSDQYQHTDTPFASSPSAPSSMFDIASEHGIHNDEIDLLDNNLQRNGSFNPDMQANDDFSNPMLRTQDTTLSLSPSGTSTETISVEHFLAEGWGYREEADHLPPHAWSKRNNFSGLTSAGSDSEGRSSFLDDVFSGPEHPSGESLTNPSTVSNGNTGEQSCHESSED